MTTFIVDYENRLGYDGSSVLDEKHGLCYMSSARDDDTWMLSNMI